MEYLFSFEKLQVWSDARNLVKFIYSITSHFPDLEKYGLTSQMRRCAISIISNIAEGAGRTSPKDQSHLYQISFSSCFELLSQMIVAVDLSYVQLNDLKSFRSVIKSITIKLDGLRNKCLNP